MISESLLLELLDASTAPLTAPALLKLARTCAGRGVKKEQVEAHLAALVQAGRVFTIVLNGKKPPQPSYTTHSLDETAAQMLHARLHASAVPLKAAALRMKLPIVLRPHFESALGLLQARGQAFYLPKATPLLLARAPRPADLLDAATTRRLRLLVDQANQLRATPTTLEELLAWLDGEAPSVLPGNQLKPELQSDQLQDDGLLNTVAECPPLTPELLRQWYAHDQQRSSTSMIRIVQTWRHFQAWAAAHGAKADRQELRRMIETLYNDGQILLEPCERPQDLTEEERALLVPLALGPPGCFWSWAQ